MRARLADPVTRLVAVVSLVAGVLATGVAVAFPGTRAVLDTAAIDGPWLLAVLVAVTCVGELTVVRLRHGAAVEELTLCEAAIIVAVLLLPAREALGAAVAGLLVATLIQRRPLVKAVFNLATYAAGAAALVAIVHLVAGTPGTVTALVVAGVTLGTFAFTAVNLCCLAQILGVVGDARPGQVVREQARLSAYMAIGAVATGLPTAALVLHAPLLLPFMAMPALAVTFAYRAAAQESDERARSAVLLRLSHALAERDDVVRRFLPLVREAFGADTAMVVLDGTGVALTADAAAPDDVVDAPVPALPFEGEPALVTDGLPDGRRQLLTAPLEAGGRRYGTVALATRGRRRGRLSTHDLTVLTPLASALAAAIAGGEHLDRLLEETSKLQAITEQSTEGILMVDGDGVVQMWSRAFAELTGWSRDRAHGRRLADLLDVPDEAERALLLPADPARPAVVTELTIRRPDGERRRLRLAHSAVFAGDALVRDVVVARDRTLEHRTERLKSDFIATVSHELRTPLTPIVGYLDLLRTRGDRMTPQKRRDCVDLLADRAAHLSRLVEDLLIASRIDDPDTDPAMHVRPGSHDLAGIVRRAVRGLDAARLVLDLPDGPVPVECDDGRALQVVANLVGNALKYSPDPEPVTVALRLDGTEVCVDVADRGRGIPCDQLELVFEKFHRVEDPMTMSTSGTGLGLFIARRLARAMGGDIRVASTLGAGSTFTLSLSAAEPAPTG